VKRIAFLGLLLVGCASAPKKPDHSTITELPTHGPQGPVEEGMASWYGREQHGHLTANGERFDMNALTAAHKKLKMQTRVRVTNRTNGRSVVVRINDRGPYARGRIIDLSYAAAKALDMLERGVVPVRVEVLP
jgi:rare lipoprotein A